VTEWYARPVLGVSDMERSLAFYVGELGFTQDWSYEDGGQTFVAQASRQGCELIFSTQWPERVGKGLMFLSLDPAVLDALRVEREGRGVNVKDGNWGYRLMVVTDPDGNELFFNYPNEASA